MHIDHKAAFLRLAVRLSPENLSCDGELSRAQVATRRREIDREWRSLEVKVGRKVTEHEAYGWGDEVSAYRRAEAERVMAAEPSHPLLRHAKAGVWTRQGRPSRYTGNRSAAYYVWGPGHSGDNYQLFSEFAYRFGPRERIGEFASLDDAVAAGEAFLAQITAEFAVKAVPLYLAENLLRELERLPEDYPVPTLEEIEWVKATVG